MNHPFSLYDAFVSISVPSDRMRAVADAKEDEMDGTLVTKQDLRSLELKLEDHFRRLEQRHLERSVFFWFGLAFFTLLGVMIVLTLPLA